MTSSEKKWIKQFASQIVEGTRSREAFAARPADFLAALDREIGKARRQAAAPSTIELVVRLKRETEKAVFVRVLSEVGGDAWEIEAWFPKSRVRWISETNLVVDEAMARAKRAESLGRETH